MKSKCCQGMSLNCVKVVLKRQLTLIKVFGTVIILASAVAIWYAYSHSL